MMYRLSLGLLGLLVVGNMVGCAGRAQFWPNPEPSLRRSSAEFAADSAKRFPYKSDAPRGGEAIGRSQVGYTLNRLEVLNLSDQDWNDVEVWVNQSYVVHLPHMPRKSEGNSTIVIPFQAIYNGDGQSFPTNNRKTLINKVEVFHDGKMYDLPKQLAD